MYFVLYVSSLVLTVGTVFPLQLTGTKTLQVPG